MMIRRFCLGLMTLGFLLFSMATFATATPNSNGTSTSIAPMLQKALPAIVNIRADIKITDLSTLVQLQRENALNINGPLPDTFLSIGSGVIVDANKGYILTNSHVVNDAQTITVTLGDGRHYTAKLIGLDKPSDIALLQIKAKKLTAIVVANSNDLQVGDFVAAIGNPFGLNQTVTTGIVSALGRTTLGIEAYENFIQTDAPINPGNSGGALLDAKGALIGINTAIIAPERGSVGIGFAIPSNMAKSIMDQLLQYGNVKRGILGIAAQDISPDLQDAFKLPNTQGAAITLVRGGSPAQKAGIEVGDIVLSINNQDIHNANDVSNDIGFMRVNTKVTLKILRNNKPMTLSSVLIDPQELKDASVAINPFFNGVALKNFSLVSPLQGAIRGVLVVNVDPESHAWQADLRPGDVITYAAQQKINNAVDLEKITRAAKDTLLLNVLRGPGAVFIVISKDPS